METSPNPSAWVMRFLPLVHPGSVILDVACGSGRHLCLGLDAGHRMVGIDRELTAARGLPQTANLELIEADLETGEPWPLGQRRFGGVIVTNYLWRPILRDIVEAVASDGVLIYETFGVGQERFGRPRSPEFLLRPGELIDSAKSKLLIVAYENVVLPDPQRVVQRIAAVGYGHPLAATLGLGR